MPLHHHLHAREKQFGEDLRRRVGFGVIDCVRDDL